jgi:hypothetical protein
VLKQRGYYVAVDNQGTIFVPNDADAGDVLRMIEMVHQVGWQVRLGDHIRSKDSQYDYLTGTTRNNKAYLHTQTGSKPFENLGKPGYEAETRELMAMMADNATNNLEEPTRDEEQSD